MIKQKIKKCKGNGEAKGHGCGEMKFRYKYGLCYHCFMEWWNTSWKAEVMRKSRRIRSKPPVKKKKPKIKEQNNESLASLINSVRTLFQKLIRYRDYGKPCVCCGEPMGAITEYDGGHFIAANKCSQLVFHPDNVHGQRRECNRLEDGNYNQYFINIQKRIGSEKFEELFEIKKKFFSYKWDRHQLYRMRKHYSNQLRLVESGEIETDEIDFSIGIVK